MKCKRKKRSARFHLKFGPFVTGECSCFLFALICKFSIFHYYFFIFFISWFSWIKSHILFHYSRILFNCVFLCLSSYHLLQLRSFLLLRALHLTNTPTISSLYRRSSFVVLLLVLFTLHPFIVKAQGKRNERGAARERWDGGRGRSLLLVPWRCLN